MTSNEAISRIKFLLDVGGSDGFTSSDKEALNTAINALSECKNPKTNGDRIRAMTDEELVRFLNIGSICHEMMKDRKACPNCSCGDCIRMWLNRKRGKE